MIDDELDLYLDRLNASADAMDLECARAHWVSSMCGWTQCLAERDHLRETLRLVSDQVGSYTDAVTIMRDREPWLFQPESSGGSL